MRTRAAGGHGMIMVLFVLAMLGTLSVATSLGIHASGRALDTHQEFAATQSLADGALEEALARLASGEKADFARRDSAGDVRVEMKQDELVIQAAFQSRRPGANDWATVHMTVALEEVGSRFLIKHCKVRGLYQRHPQGN